MSIDQESVSASRPLDEPSAMSQSNLDDDENSMVLKMDNRGVSGEQEVVAPGGELINDHQGSTSQVVLGGATGQFPQHENMISVTDVNGNTMMVQQDEEAKGVVPAVAPTNNNELEIKQQVSFGQGQQTNQQQQQEQEDKQYAQDLPVDYEEYIEFKGDYREVKRRCKAMRKDPNTDPEDLEEKQETKKQMRQMMKQCEKLHPDWKAQYKAQRRQKQ